MTHRRSFQPLTTTYYDAIVIGTALPQALLAAALARSGSTVLHLDPLSFYGSSTATLTTHQLSSAISNVHTSDHESNHNVEQSSPQNFEAIPVPPLTLCETVFPLGARLLANGSVQASIDLVPRPLMAAGAMVDVLVRSDVGHYLDFRSLDALYVQFASGLRRVPASRSDVFQSRSISMPEKRLLMRFVKRCQESAGHDGPEGSLDRFMNEMALTPTLRTFLTKSIAFSPPHVSAREGVNSVYKYQQSLMRFGTKTPFLYPNYGSGELAQAFCRLCAVHGGTYVLRRGATALIRRQHNSTESDRPVGVVTTENEVIQSRNVFIPNALLNPPCEQGSTVWRVAAVIDGSITQASQPDRVLITVPADVLGNRVDVRIRQLDSSVMICESGTYVIYAETVGAGTEDDVLAAVFKYVRVGEAENVPNGVREQISSEEGADEAEDEILDCQTTEMPHLLWGISYARPVGSQANSEVDGIIPMPSAEEGIGADQFIEEARRCFLIARPDGEFFPEARANENPEAVDEGAPNGHIAKPESNEAAGD